MARVVHSGAGVVTRRAHTVAGAMHAMFHNARRVVQRRTPLSRGRRGYCRAKA